MGSKRNLAMVKKALKEPAPPPFSKISKENYHLNYQPTKEKSCLQKNGSISTEKNRIENAMTDKNNIIDKERVEIPILSPVINANISSSFIKETQGSTNTSNKKLLKSLPEFTSTKEVPTGKCKEVSNDNCQVESQKLPIENKDAQDSVNSNFNFKISLPISMSIDHNFKLRFENKQKAKNDDEDCETKIKACVQSEKQVITPLVSKISHAAHILPVEKENNLTKTPTISKEREDVYNVESLKSLCLKQAQAMIKTDNKLLVYKVTSLLNSPCRLEEENSETNEDFSGTDSGDDWRPKHNNKRKLILPSLSSSSSSRSSSSSSSGSSSSSSSGSSSSSTSRSSSSSTSNASASVKKGKKRRRNVAAWKKNKTKTLKNSGKEYVSRTGKIVQAKSMKPPCSEKCRLSCVSKFTPLERKKIFDNYWQLSSFQRQRDYLSSCTTILQVPFRRIKATATKERKPNCCFSFSREGKATRVCKTFLINTLGIGERTLRTVTEAKTIGTGVIPIDGRGKHSKHQKLDPEISQSVRDHINSIPRIESHYLRANTSREFIDGGLTIADMHRHYKEKRDGLKKNAANYDFYANIFNTEFNISFFIPKKDQCDTCEAYKNADGEAKLALEDAYKKHQQQKELSRDEKKRDKKACEKANSSSIVAIYDLQAVMPIPMGNSSAFFYKSKLNCYNFTITDIKNKSTSCYFWHEGLGNRGAIEIGSCVFKFLQEIAQSHPGKDIIFYSDNCCGQQKNRFILSMYYYAVSELNINSVTHKFLVRGHTQNEGDNAHSVIEKSIKKAKKSGPIYVPSQYVQIIRNAKKTGKPYVVHELNYDDFIELKTLSDDLGMNTNKDINGKTIKLTEIKMIKFTKNNDTYQYKTSYEEEEWTEVPIKIRSGRSSRKETNIQDIELKPAYANKIIITGRKKNDLTTLIKDNIVPKQYSYFFDSLF